MWVCAHSSVVYITNWKQIKTKAHFWSCLTQPDHLTMYSNTRTCFFCFWSFFSSEAETLTKIKTFVTGVKSHFVPKIIPFCIHVFYHYYYCCKITFRLCFYFHYFSLLFTQFKPLQPQNKNKCNKTPHGQKSLCLFTLRK